MKLTFTITLIIVSFFIFQTSYAEDESTSHATIPLNNLNWPSTITESWQEIDRSLVQIKHFLDKNDFTLMHQATRNMTIAVRALQQEVYVENANKPSKMKHYLNKLTRSLSDLYIAIKKKDTNLIDERLNNIEKIIEKVRKNHPPE